MHAEIFSNVIPAKLVLSVVEGAGIYFLFSLFLFFPALSVFFAVIFLPGTVF